MLLTKVLITCLFYFDTSVSEEIEIARFIPDGARDEWSKVRDKFYIPQSACQPKNSQLWNYCTTSVCKIGGTGNVHRYSCSCPASKATLTYYNNQWRCRENVEARTQLGFEVNNFFKGEAAGGKLRTLNTLWVRETKLRQNMVCAINISTSWYIGCHGTKESLEGNKGNFSLFVPENEDRYWLKVLNDSLLAGRVVNLGISCTSGPKREGCLLFKLEGNIKCPIEKPRHNLSSSIVPTSTSSQSIATVSPSSTQTRAFSSIVARPKTNPSQAPSQPSSGSQQKRDDAKSSSPIGLIIGVTVSILTILLFVAAVFFYRRHKSRKDAHTSTTSQSKKEILERTPETKAAFQPEAQNGYVTCKSKKPGNPPSDELYASLDVPEGHNIYGPGNAQEPFYNVLQEPSSGNEEDGQNYGTISLEQPMYNAYVLEDLSGMGPEKAEEDGPNRVEPVYNVLEEPYPGKAESSEHYGAISVDDPYYNTLEESYGRNGQPTNAEPVYNTLEEPYPSGEAEDDSYGPRGLQDPVYNVLEGPSTDVIDSNIPTYAVVNKKKR